MTTHSASLFTLHLGRRQYLAKKQMIFWTMHEFRRANTNTISVSFLSCFSSSFLFISSFLHFLVSIFSVSSSFSAVSRLNSLSSLRPSFPSYYIAANSCVQFSVFFFFFFFFFFYFSNKNYTENINIYVFYVQYSLPVGARGSVIGWGTMLQAGRSRVRVAMRWNFSIDLILPAVL
jgi:hypothetical protein